MSRSPVRARVAALAAIVLTSGAMVMVAGPQSALAATYRAGGGVVAGVTGPAGPAVDRCPAGSDYIDLDGMQIRSKVVDITNPATNLQHGEVVCGEHVYRVERTKSGGVWQEWHTY